MKNFENKNNQSAQDGLSVSVNLHGFPFVRDLVQKLSYRNSDNHSGINELGQYGKILESSSIEAYITGYINLVNKTDNVRMSFTSSFFFTCTLESGGENRMAWAHSLS